MMRRTGRFQEYLVDPQTTTVLAPHAGGLCVAACGAAVAWRGDSEEEPLPSVTRPRTHMGQTHTSQASSKTPGRFRRQPVRNTNPVLCSSSPKRPRKWLAGELDAHVGSSLVLSLFLSLGQNELGKYEHVQHFCVAF